tara:strand:+ start:4312 stop:5331 length:1020 start_codon:yes stop_codon:yes gene_type:complete
MKTLHVAVIGTGSIGSRHVAVLQQIRGVVPIAISVSANRAYLNERVLAASSVAEAAAIGATLCVVSTDTGRHAADARMAAAYGLDVLVEKPLDVDAVQGNRLCEQVSESGRRLYVGYVLRFSESLNLFRQLRMCLGSLHSVRIECQSYLPEWRQKRPYRESYSARAEEGGVLRDLSHEIDYAGWLFGWPKTLQANIINHDRLGIMSEEAVDLLWEGSDGCCVSMRLDYLSRPARRRMIAAGELGTLEWDAVTGVVTLSLVGEDPVTHKVDQTRDDMFTEEHRAFISACQEKHGDADDPRLVTGEEGLRTLSVCDAARRAGSSRREESVDYFYEADTSSL